MNVDTELEQWRQDWQSDDALASDLRKKVERQSRSMRIMLAGEILVTLLIGGGVISLAFRSPGPHMDVLAGATWLFLIAAWTFSFRVNRGNWSPSALDTATFLHLSVRRCYSRLASLRFGAALFFCEIVFCLGWIYHQSAKPRQPLLAWLFFGSLGVDIAWALTVIFVVVLFWYWRRKRAELSYLLQLRHEFTGTAGENLAAGPPISN